MLKDRYFYPLAIALIAGIIWYALSKGTHEKLIPAQILENGYIIEKENLTKLIASPGTSCDYVKETSHEAAYAILKSSKARDKSPPSIGVFAPLGPTLETTFAERDLRITVRARQGKNNPLSEFDIGYFTADVGDSGWKRITLTPKWENYVMEFTPKAPVNNLGVDFFGIWPGEKGDGQTMDIQLIKIDVLPKLRN